MGRTLFYSLRSFLLGTLGFSYTIPQPLNHHPHQPQDLHTCCSLILNPFFTRLTVQPSAQCYLLWQLLCCPIYSLPPFLLFLFSLFCSFLLFPSFPPLTRSHSSSSWSGTSWVAQAGPELMILLFLWTPECWFSVSTTVPTWLFHLPI